MSLEAAAGKNPVSHVGKIYNVVAQRICEKLIAGEPEIAAVECRLVSRIGAAITEPALIDVRLMAQEGAPPAKFAAQARAIVADELRSAPALVDAFVDGGIAVF